MVYNNFDFVFVAFTIISATNDDVLLTKLVAENWAALLKSSLIRRGKVAIK